MPMPIIYTAINLGNVLRTDVWPTLTAFERYPAWMDDVIRVEILNLGSDYVVTVWEIMLDRGRYTWTERNLLRAPSVIEFEQIEGDLEVWRGRWELVEHGANLWIALRVEFDFGVCSLSEIMDPIGEWAIRVNSQRILDVIRCQLHWGCGRRQ